MRGALCAAGLCAALLGCSGSSAQGDGASETAPDGGAEREDAGGDRDGAAGASGQEAISLDPAPGACADDDADAPPSDGAETCNAMNWFAHVSDLRGCDLTGIDARMLSVGTDWLRGMRSFDLVGCSIENLDVVGVTISYRCVAQRNGRFALVGPGADLSGADLTDAELGEATLSGVRAHDLPGCPASTPAGVRCVETQSGRFSLVGPEVELAGADLRGADLSGIALLHAHTAGLDACPEQLPSSAFSCVAETTCGFALVGPSVDLRAAQLAGVDLSARDLHGADLSQANLVGADLREANLEDALVSADLRDAELAGARVEGARIDSFSGCPSSVPSDAYRCVVVITPPFGPYDFDMVDRSRCDEPYAGESEWACGYVLVGPGLVIEDRNLDGSDLRDLDLGGADMSGTGLIAVKAYGLLGCPSELAQEWRCLGPLDDGSFAIVGMAVDLRGADLSGAALQARDLLRARATELEGCPASLPDGFVCAAQAGGTQAVVGPRIDAHGANLAGMQLVGAELWESRLEGADLEGAVLDGVDLGHAYLAGANLKNASAMGANFGESAHDNVEGEGGDLTSADFSGADLRGADLRLSQMSGAKLAGAALAGAASSNLASFDGAADGCPASLPSSEWRCVAQPLTNLHALVGPGADLRLANFERADFGDANLTDVDLEGATLRLADLSGVTWSNTTCPDGTNSDDHAQTCVGFP